MEFAMSERKKKKVVFLIDCLYGDAGGGSERQFLQTYAQYEAIGIDPYVVFLKDRKVHPSIRWLRPPLTLGLESFAHPQAIVSLYRLWRFLRREHIEIVHTLFDDATILGALLKRFCPKITLIGSQRNLGYARRWPKSVLAGMALRTADLVVVNASIIRDFVIKDSRVSPRRVIVINNLYEPKDSSSSEAESIVRDLRRQHDVLVLTVANLRPIKGIEDLIEAARQTRDNPRIGYVIIGDGELKGHYNNLIQEKGLTDQVHLLGYRTDTDSFLRHVDIGLLPSRSEGLSNALVEYMFADLPIIATDVGGNREALDDGASGRLVPACNPPVLAQTILEFANNPEEARALGKRAGESARRRYDRQLILNAFRSLYLTGSNSSQ